MRKIALWMTYLYFFICPIEFILNSFFGSSVKYIAIVAAAFILMFFVGTPKQKIRITSFQICILLWAIFEAASYIWTLETLSTVKILTTYLMMSVLVLAISIFPFTEKEFDNIFIFYTVGALMLSFFLLLFGKDYLGYAISGRVSIEINGVYQDPNELSANILAPIFYSLYRTFKKDKPLFNILFAVSFIIMSVAVFLTGSRGSLVAFAISLLVFVLIRSSKKNRIIIIAALPFILIVSYLVLRSVLGPHIFNRLFNFSDYMGGNGRIGLWTAALSQVIRHPFFGGGITSYMGFFLQNYNNAQAMHNSFLALLCDVGIVGTSLFVYPMVKSFFYAAKQKNGTICASIAVSVLCSFFIDALLVRFLWNVIIIGSVYYNINHPINK